MKREIDARTAIKKLRDIQVELREIQSNCMVMSYNETINAVEAIQEIKTSLDKSTGTPVFV